MKRAILCLCLALALLLAAVPALADLNIQPLRDNSRFKITVDNDISAAYIESTMEPKDLAFTHRYDTTNRYSFTSFDIILTNYNTDSMRSTARLLIYYTAPRFQNIESVTFTLGGQDYTFSDIHPNGTYQTTDSTGIQEIVLVRFGYNTDEFYSALRSLVDEHTFEELQSITIPMVLHGDEDIAAVLTGNFMVDFFYHYYAMVAIGADPMSNFSTSDMSVSPHY